MDADEIAGLVAAFLAALSFGSYTVPMKGEAATRVDVDPLVFQSYKAFTVLVRCIFCAHLYMPSFLSTISSIKSPCLLLHTGHGNGFDLLQQCNGRR